MGEKTLQLHSPDKLGQNSRSTFALLPSCCVCAGTRKKYTDTRHTNICPHTSSTNQRPRRCAVSDATVVGGGGARCRVVLCASKGEATKTKALKNTPLAPITFHPNERAKRLTARAARHGSSSADAKPIDCDALTRSGAHSPADSKANNTHNYFLCNK